MSTAIERADYIDGYVFSTATLLARGWCVTGGMWQSPYDDLPYTRAEAESIELERGTHDGH